jgi:hypothetical protein
LLEEESAPTLPRRSTANGVHREEAAVQKELTREELARLLREAEQAHGEYERELGSRDEDWPTWYADYILSRLEGPPA